jgi:glycosyltransferase involved in cell wall biosynthesis
MKPHRKNNDARTPFFLDRMESEVLPISVLIPAYNRADSLNRALASVAAQEMQPIEVIVVDDGSVDETAANAEAWGARVVRHELNQGCAIARNSGLAVAGQPWIAMLDSDDEWLPHHLASLWPLRGNHLVIANSALQCGPNPAGDRLLGTASERPQLLREPASLVYPGNPIPTSAALVRREAAQAAGGFRPPRVDDLDLWLRLLERGTGLLSPVVGAVYHIHDSQISSGGEANQRMHETVSRRFEDRPWWSETRLERWRGKAAWNNVRTMVRERHPARALRQLAYIAASPQRLYGAFSAARIRAKLRRRCGELSAAVRLERITSSELPVDRDAPGWTRANA